MRRHPLPLVACTAFSMAIGNAHAQNLDYREMETIFGEPVTTSVTGSPQRVSDVPAAMTIITAEQISRAAAVDIPGILREYTDLDVLQFARGDSEVSVRGYDKAVSSRLLVLINDRQVYLDNRGFTDWQSLPVQLSEIRQIEVVKGPNSALFGFNASGGVVNIVTANPMYDSVNTMTVRAGSNGYKETSVVGTAPIGTMGGLRLSAGGFDASNFPTNSLWEGPGSVTSIRNWDKGIEKRSVNLDGSFRLQDNIEGRVEASHSQDTRLLYFDDGYTYNVHTTVDSAKGTVTADTRLGQIDATIYTNIGDMRDQFGDDFRTVLAVAKLQGLFKAGADHSFRVATEYRHNGMNTTPVEGAHVAYSDLSASGMWAWSVAPQWDLTNALRLDRLELSRDGASPLNSAQTNGDYSRQSRNTVSGNSNLTHKLTDVDTLRLSFGRGVEVPSLTTYGLQERWGVPGLLPNGLVTGNPELQPTTVTNYEFAYSRDLRPWSAKLSSLVFLQKNDNLISQGNTSFANLFATGRPISYIDIGSSSAIGTEFGIDGHTDQGLRWAAKYRFETISEHLRVNNSANNYDADYAGSAPHHLLTGNVGYTLGKWDFDLFTRASSSYSMRPVTQTGTYPPYIVAGYLSADARIGYNLTSAISLAVSAVNMQQQTTRFTAGQSVERQFYGTVVVKY